MATFDTTATAQADSYIEAQNPTRNYGSGASFGDVTVLGSERRMILSYKIPPQPTGVDRIDKIKLVLTLRALAGADGVVAFSKISKLWQEGTGSGPNAVNNNNVTWNNYDTGSAWGTAGGDLDTEIGRTTLLSSSSAGATYSFDITSAGLNWGSNFSVIGKHSTAGFSSGGWWWSRTGTATYASMPQVVITATDNPPIGINNLRVEPDVSLSESSYTFRQRAILKWTPSSENDFRRYRIRFGKNRSLAANHTHLAFINSRASTSYLDSTLYTDGTTIYYSIYPEDTRNGSTSTFLGATYCNVSNIVSWQKPDAIIGSVNYGSSASFLDEVEVRVRTTTMANAKKVKVVWGDKGISYSQNLTSAGGYLYARHRYTTSTSSYPIRALIEDIYGFRSSLDSYATNLTINNLGPVAKIVASPSRQRTAATFSFGYGPSSPDSTAGPGTLIDQSTPSPADGVGTRFRTRATGTTLVIFAQLWRLEGSRFRCIYSDRFSLGTAGQNIGRNINWSIKRGDYVGIQNTGATANLAATSGGVLYLITNSTTAFSPGQSVDRLRAGYQAYTPNARVAVSYTNPIHFSSKDSFARGANRAINRFQWDVNYNGVFSSDYNTSATTSFYYAWTTATTQFVAVKASDDALSIASSIDVAGVIIETEATFNLNSDLRDGYTRIRGNRARAFSRQRALSLDYGVVDSGALDSVELDVEGVAYTMGTSLTWIDIDRLSACLQQRKRMILIPPWSTSTTVSGYVMDFDPGRESGNPIQKPWSMKIAYTPT